MSDVLVVAPIHEDALQLMRDAGLGVTDARGKSADEIRQLIKTHRALLGRAGVKIDDELLAEASQLRVVAVGSVGMDSLDLPYLYSRGLKVFNAAGGNRNAVAEHPDAARQQALRGRDYVAREWERSAAFTSVGNILRAVAMRRGRRSGRSSRKTRSISIRGRRRSC